MYIMGIRVWWRKIKIKEKEKKKEKKRKRMDDRKKERKNTLLEMLPQYFHNKF